MNRILWFTVLCIILSLIFLISGCGEENYRQSLKEANQLAHQGRVNDSQVDLEAAIKKYQEAYSFAVSSLEKEYDALYSLGVLLAQGGFFNKCIDILAEAYEINQSDPELYNYWGMCYANRAQMSIDDDEKIKLANQAIEIYQRGLQVDASHYRLHYGIGVVYGFILEDYEQAVNSLQIAHDRNDEDINTLFALGNINYQSGNVEESIQHYQKILELTEPESEFYKKASENLSKIR